MSLTVCYISCRHENKLEWFLASLRNQAGDEPVELIIVDFFADEHARRWETTEKIRRFGGKFNFKIVPPKPTVWQGSHRLTKQDWFAASNMRNTGLCLCATTHIVFVDDLSVLLSNWYAEIKQAATLNDTITLGSYRKVRKLVVKDGVVSSFDQSWSGGIDSRWSYGGNQELVVCNGDILYGCSFVAPMEALLTIGGFPEICDGLGFEDVITGMALRNAGYKFLYNKRMLTYESDELHSVEPAFKRECFEKHPNDPTDKAHAVLNMGNSGIKYFENYYAGGMRRLREEVLSGYPFPILNNPAHEWHTGVALSEL